eukprot:5178833-Amphidinium_carterae.1
MAIGRCIDQGIHGDQRQVADPLLPLYMTPSSSGPRWKRQEPAVSPSQVKQEKLNDQRISHESAGVGPFYATLVAMCFKNQGSFQRSRRNSSLLHLCCWRAHGIRHLTAIGPSTSFARPCNLATY